MKAPKILAMVFALSCFNVNSQTYDNVPDNFDENDHTIIVDGLICATLGCGPHIENAKPDADKKWGSGYWIKYN